jgi:ribonuclease R
VITAVTGFGLFVELTDIYVEGLVHVTALPGDYYHFDPVHHRLAGERSGRSFRLGDSVEVKVMRVDLDERKIDFEIAQSTLDSPFGRKREAAGRSAPSGTKGAAGNTDVQRSRELKKALLNESKSSAGKGHGGKPAGKSRKSPAKGSASTSGARKRKAKP